MARYTNAVIREQETADERAYKLIYGSKSEKKVPVSSILMWTFAVGVICFVLGSFIKLQSDVTSFREEKARLNSEYEALRLSNDLYEKNIASGVDLSEVERIAMEDLGMTLAGEGQIIIYDSNMEDYVKQYALLPNAQ